MDQDIKDHIDNLQRQIDVLRDDFQQMEELYHDGQDEEDDIT